jgi:predicted DCC family thiol-disulfide oxidoreductase YuxK
MASAAWGSVSYSPVRTVRPDVTDASEGPVVLFDGVCNLCAGSLPWLLRMDRRDRLRFGTLQSERAAELLVSRGLSADYDESMVVVDDGTAYTESDAVVRLAWLLGFPWAVGAVAALVPSSLRDRLYRWIANNRYDWFGKRDACLSPDEELRARFIDDGVAPDGSG